MLQMLIGTNLPFMKHRRVAYAISGALVLATAVWLVVHRGPYLSVDFTGGSVLQIRTSQVLPADQLRTALDAGGFHGAELHKMTAEHAGEYIIRLKAQTGTDVFARMQQAIGQRFPGTTNTQRSDLGLTVRNPEPTPIPPPASAPNIDVLSVDENTVRIRLHDPANPTRRGKPAGVDGAAIFSFVGDDAPTAEATWRFEGNTTRTAINVTFPNTGAPGSKVWFTAFWFNERKQSGPAATPVGTNLPGGAAMAA